ncbi:hypothetical protein SAMN05519103_09523 [Rhizobiales bacterium GAS113]|nr:hypothetical protein SAMN05519103_09523 [Rhizobiales bacterium GAS113]
MRISKNSNGSAQIVEFLIDAAACRRDNRYSTLGKNFDQRIGITVRQVKIDYRRVERPAFIDGAFGRGNGTCQFDDGSAGFPKTAFDRYSNQRFILDDKYRLSDERRQTRCPPRMPLAMQRLGCNLTHYRRPDMPGEIPSDPRPLTLTTILSNSLCDSRHSGANSV